MDPTVDDLYPDLTPEEREEAAENLHRYVGLMVRVYERLLADPEAYAKAFPLTDRDEPSTMTATEPGPDRTGSSNP